MRVATIDQRLKQALPPRDSLAPDLIDLLCCNLKIMIKNKQTALITTLTALALQISFIPIASAQGLTPSITTEDLSNITEDDNIGLDNLGGITGIGGIPDLGAEFGDSLPNPIGDLFERIVEIVGDVETFLSDLGIEVDVGELGLPDLEVAFELFESDNQIDIASDAFGTQTGSTAVNADSLRKQYLKDLGNQYAQNSALSKNGQEITAEQVQLAQETVEISSQYAQNSNSQDVSQNILRNISNQLALQQQLDNMHYFAQQEDKVARSLMLSIQGESVVALDKLTTTRNREAIGVFKAATYYQGLLSIPAQHLLISE